MKIIRPVAITDANFVSSNVPETDYAAYNVGTTYALGAHVISTATHRIYESLQGSNVGNPLPVSPATSTAFWLDVGATNRWKMFDRGVSVLASQADSISVVLTPGRIDSVALLNIDAQSYRVILAAEPGSPSDIVYDSGEVSLGLDSNVSDWYEYFFEPTATRKSEVVLTDLPQYVSGVLTIMLVSPAATVSIGELIVGQYRSLGDTQWNAKVGIIDYSIKAVDDFGNVTVTERAFSKRLTADAFLDNASVDEVIRILAAYRATALVWVGTEEFTSTIIYGYYKSFDLPIQSPAGSFLSLEVEGLI
jgi:hypothetical protein